MSSSVLKHLHHTSQQLLLQQSVLKRLLFSFWQLAQFSNLVNAQGLPSERTHKALVIPCKLPTGDTLETHRKKHECDALQMFWARRISKDDCSQKVCWTSSSAFPAQPGNSLALVNLMRPALIVGHIIVSSGSQVGETQESHPDHKYFVGPSSSQWHHKEI